MLKFVTSPTGPKGQTSASVPAVGILMSSDPHSRGKWHAAIFSHRRWHQPKSSESDGLSWISHSKLAAWQEALGDGGTQSVPLADERRAGLPWDKMKNSNWITAILWNVARRWRTRGIRCRRTPLHQTGRNLPAPCRHKSSHKCFSLSLL